MPYSREEVMAMLAACEQFTNWAWWPNRSGKRASVAGVHSVLAVLGPAHRRRRKFPRGPPARKPPVSVYAEDRHAGLYPSSPVRGRGPRRLPEQERALLVLDRHRIERHAGGNSWRTFRCLCEIAAIGGGHPHRFRDTLAVELLLERMPMERVSVLLGHS